MLFATGYWKLKYIFALKPNHQQKPFHHPPLFDPTILFSQKLLYEIVDVYILESVKRISSAIITSCVQHTI